MKKMEEIRQQSSENLLKQVDELKKELFDLRFQQATGNLENPARIREIRKTIARIKTVLTERQNNAEGGSRKWKKDQLVRFTVV